MVLDSAFCKYKLLVEVALFYLGMQVHCISVSEHVWVMGQEGGGRGGGGVRGVGGCYQPGVYVPLKALFLVFKYVYWYMKQISGDRLQDHWSSGFLSTHSTRHVTLHVNFDQSFVGISI